MHNGSDKFPDPSSSAGSIQSSGSPSSASPVQLTASAQFFSFGSTGFLQLPSLSSLLPLAPPWSSKPPAQPWSIGPPYKWNHPASPALQLRLGLQSPWLCHVLLSPWLHPGLHRLRLRNGPSFSLCIHSFSCPFSSFMLVVLPSISSCLESLFWLFNYHWLLDQHLNFPLLYQTMTTFQCCDV